MLFGGTVDLGATVGQTVAHPMLAHVLNRGAFQIHEHEALIARNHLVQNLTRRIDRHRHTRELQTFSIRSRLVAGHHEDTVVESPGR